MNGEAIFGSIALILCGFGCGTLISWIGFLGGKTEGSHAFLDRFYC